MRGNSWLGSKREPVISPALQKPLLKLHRAMDVKSFWKSVHRLLSASIAYHSVGLLLQQNLSAPVIAKWTRFMPDDFFAAKALKRCAVQRPRKRLVRLNDLFRNRSSFVRSGFYRRYMAPQKCAHGIALFFWKRQRLICAIAILRTTKQGDFSTTEMKLLRQLYPQFLAALRGLESVERERCVRADFEEFLQALPLPTIILRWNLRPIYQNTAAREFCAVWEKGPEEAKRTKASSPIPVEILDRCRGLKQEWMDARRRMSSEQRTDFKEEQVRHPRSSHLRATIQFKQINSVGVAGPHFFIACGDLCPNPERSRRHGIFRFPGLACLPKRGKEDCQASIDGRTNKQ